MKKAVRFTVFVVSLDTFTVAAAILKKNIMHGSEVVFSIKTISQFKV
jgi:hypothetical protein